MRWVRQKLNYADACGHTEFTRSPITQEHDTPAPPIPNDRAKCRECAEHHVQGSFSAAARGLEHHLFCRVL